MEEENQNVFIVTLYSFIPLQRCPKGEYKELMKDAPVVPPHRLVKYMDAKYCVVELKKDGCDFYFECNRKGTMQTLKVHLRAWLYHFSSVVNPLGRYYLATTISIDKAFEHESLHDSFGQDIICTSQDIVQLKKASYGGCDTGLYNYDGSNRRSIQDYLNSLIERITGKNPNGRYGRYYAVDVCGVDFRIGNRIDGRNHLTDLYSEEYYGREKKPYDEVIKHYQEFVYGLIYGNDNNCVIPNDTLDKTLKDSFSNNISERLFAGHKTVVFLHTHHPFPWKESNNGRKRNLRQDVEHDQIIYDVLLVMEAKLKLKSIEESLQSGYPKTIKDALASISKYLSANPYHLGEYGPRYKMLYKNMGINDLLESIKEQGNLVSDSKEIENNERLNKSVLWLTAITMIIGGLSLIVNILR